MSSEEESDAVYHPEDAIANATRMAGVMGFAGLGLSAIQNTLSRSNMGAWGMFTKTGTTAATFSEDHSYCIAVVGEAYQTSRNGRHLRFCQLRVCEFEGKA